jgi:ABC-type nitrate/sulfonate/bicarbonate transport system permease component
VKATLGTNSILPHLFGTITRTLLATFFGATVGIGLGLLLGWKKNFGLFLETPIELLRTVPPLAYLPFLSLWFGPTYLAIFLLVFLGTFFMIVINTMTAIKNVDSVYINFAKTLGANERAVYRTIIIPSILPELTGGIRVILVYSWGITIAGELLGVKRGIGQVLMTLTTFAAISQILAATIWVDIIAIIIDRIYVVINNRILRWKERLV